MKLYPVVSCIKHINNSNSNSKAPLKGYNETVLQLFQMYEDSKFIYTENYIRIELHESL